MSEYYLTTTLILIVLSSYMHTISDGNVALEKGAEVLHIVLTALSALWQTCILHTHLL